MILSEGIFSLSFCLVRQLSLNFTVSSSTDKGSEVTFFFIGRLAYCQICLLVSRLCNAEAWIKWQESSCYFTNVTFQLSARSDTLETCTAHALGLCFVFGFCSFIVVTSRGDLMVGTLSFCFPPRGILVEDVFSTLYLMIYWTLTYIALIFCWQTSSGPKKKKKKRSGMYALEWNARERRLEWTFAQSFTWCEIHKPHPISQIILRLLVLNYTPGVRDFECQVSWSFSFTWPRMPAHLQSQSQIAQECKGLELKGIKAVFVFIYFLVTLNKKFCHTFPFCFTR